MSKIYVIIDVIIAFFMIICMSYNMVMGIENHDAYYIILAIIDYIVFRVTLKNIEEDIDRF